MEEPARAETIETLEKESETRIAEVTSNDGDKGNLNNQPNPLECSISEIVVEESLSEGASVTDTMEKTTVEEARGEILMQETQEETVTQTSQDTQPASRLVKVDNWGIFFLQQLHMLYLNKTDCDFNLQFHDGHKLQVHRNVLNACTEFFKNSNIEGCNVLLPVEFSYEAFNAIVNFMYTGRLEYRDDIYNNMYSIAKVLKMAVLVKLLEAQIQNQDSSAVSAFNSIAADGKTAPLFEAKVGKTTKMVKKVIANGKKSIIKPLSPNFPKSTLPGKKLPIWKKRTKPLEPTPFLTTNGILKRNILDPATPVRFEWPDNTQEPTSLLDEFQDLSYETKPLLKPNSGELKYLSAEDFDSKVNTVLKRKFTEEFSEESFEKRSRYQGTTDQIYSTDDFSNVDTEPTIKDTPQIDVTFNDYDDSSDDDNAGEMLSQSSTGPSSNLNPISGNSRPSPYLNHTPSDDRPSSDSNCTPSDSRCSNDLNRTPSDSRPITPTTSTPKPILKTSGTPSSQKKVRFSLEEKENAQNIDDQNGSSIGSNKSGQIRQTNSFFNTKTGDVDSVSIVDNSGLKPVPGKPYFIEKDVASIKQACIGKSPVTEKLSVNPSSTLKNKGKVLAKKEPELRPDNAFEKKEQIMNLVPKTEATDVEHENISVEAVSVHKSNKTTLKSSESQISDQNQVSLKPDVPTGKTAPPNHARIVQEVLKKYPHLLHKNVRLKIMNPDGNKDSVMNIKINRQTSSKISKNIQSPSGKGKDSNGVVETPKKSSVKDPCKPPWLCSPCGINGKPRNFESYFLYHKHLQEIHKEKMDSRICPHCGQKFTKRNLLLYHLLTKHNVPPPRNMVFPKCDQCDYIALSESLLIKHRKSTAHQSEFECKVCCMKFKSNGALQGHMQTKLHYNEPPKLYKCLYCNDTFSRNINLKAHIRSAHMKGPPQEQVFSDAHLYDKGSMEQQSRAGSEECTLVLNSGVTLVTDATQVPLLPSSESEALNNVASGIATSIGLNDSLVNGETVILLNEGTEYFLQNSNNQGEYIVPEILSHSDQIYAFRGKDQLEQVTQLTNLCPDVPTSVSHIISEDTIVTIDDGSHHYASEYSVPLSSADQVHTRDSNQLILFTLSESDSAQKMCSSNSQTIIVTQASENLPVRPMYSGEVCPTDKIPEASFNNSINCTIPAQFGTETVVTVATGQEQNSETSLIENSSNSSGEVESSTLSIDLDRCNPDSSYAASVSNEDSFSAGSEVVTEPIAGDLGRSSCKAGAKQMEALVQDWDEFSDEEQPEEVDDDRKVSNMPCRPVFGPLETDQF
nr:PREDICTED: uncharacterized protein LOC109030135 [Bemisia tabaci]